MQVFNHKNGETTPLQTQSQVDDFISTLCEGTKSLDQQVTNFAKQLLLIKENENLLRLMLEGFPRCDYAGMYIQVFPNRNDYEIFAISEDGPLAGALKWDGNQWIGVDDCNPSNSHLLHEPFIPLKSISNFVRGSVGHKLFELRLASNESFAQICEKTGIDSQHIYFIEYGIENNPTLEVLKALAKHFRTSISYLVGEEEPYHKNSERYLWLKHYAKRIEWRDEDATFSCSRPELDEHVDRAIKNTAEAKAKLRTDLGVISVYSGATNA